MKAKKNLHNRSQSLFSSFGQNGGASPFAASSLMKENLNLGQSQLKNSNNLLNVNSLLANQNNDFSNLGNIESSLTRERPVGAGHRYNSHSMNFLPVLNPSMINSNSNSWGSPSLSNPSLAAKNPMASLNRIDFNDDKDVAANLLNTVAADRLLNSQQSTANLSGMNANFLDNANENLSITSTFNKKVNGYNQDNLLNSNDIFKNYNFGKTSPLVDSARPFTGKTSPLIDSAHSFTGKTSPLVDNARPFTEERSSPVLSNRSGSSPYLNTLSNINPNNMIENDLYKSKLGLMDESRTSNILPVNMLGNNQMKAPFQRSPLLTHKPKSSSINYLDISQKTPQIFSPGHRRGASLNIIPKKPEKSGSMDKAEKEDDEDSKVSLTLNSASSVSNEILLSPEFENLPEIKQLENDEETLVESPTILFVEYLDHSLSTNDLKPYFTKYGEIEYLKIDSDKDVAYVKYKDPKDATKVKNEMNGKMVKTSEIQITFFNTEVNEEMTTVNTPTKSLLIDNMPIALSSSELIKKFSKFGPIESTKLFARKSGGVINFEKLDDAVKAKDKMNGFELNGSALKVNYAKVPSKTESHDSESVKSLNTSSSPTTEKSKEKEKKKSEKGKKDLPQLTIPITTEYLKPSDEDQEEYFDTIPTLSEHSTKRQVDQNKLKEMRKKLEGHTTAKEIESYFNIIMSDVVGLCTDYIGNVIVQKVLDRTSDENRLKLIEQLSPHLATVGIHKNGTWVVQKIIDEAKGPVQIEHIVNGLKKYTPPLLLDQFGNYVIQCCLRLGTQNNQFIFNAIVAKCKDIGPGRFGARAIRACLESQHTTKRQQKQVAMAIVRCSTDLCVNPNGALLITWLLDTSSLPGRFRVIAPKLIPNIASFCCNKLASSTILKLVNQRVEMDARSMIIKSIFYQSDAILQEILSNPAYGVSVIQKILASACINNEEKIQLADRVRTALSQLTDIKPNQVGYKRLFEELGIIPTTKNNLNPSLFYNNAPIDIVSPLTPTTPMSSFFANFTTDPSITPSTNTTVLPNMFDQSQPQPQPPQQSQQQQLLSNSFNNENYNILQQQQQQQQRAIDTFNFQNSYLSMLNNSPSLKFGQSQGFNGNNLFNNPLLNSTEGSPSQFNGNMFQTNNNNNIFQQKQQQINPYSLLMNSGSPSFNSFYSNFGIQGSSPNMNQNTLKGLNIGSPSSSPSSGISKTQELNNINIQNPIKMKGAKNSPPKMTIQIPPSPPLSLSVGENTFV